MFGFFKKKVTKEVTPELELFAVAEGEVVAITEINDPVFSQKFMGDGYAVLPTNGVITSPVAGEVINVFPTKHAVGIKTDNGVEVLLHMGIDTVELNGKYFNALKEQGDKVKQGDKLLEVDFDGVKESGYDATVLFVVTNSQEYSSVKSCEGNKTITDTIIEIHK